MFPSQKNSVRLWTQNFIISAQVYGSVFVPVCFILLPDKKRESYDTMFSMLEEALESRGLKLSAQYFMSDFEVAIRDSFTSHFPEVTPKGCLFHYSKAVLSKVSKSGFKSDYSNKVSPQFGSFIRAILGLGYVPLYRFKEALRNLYVLAKRLTGRQRKFSRRMIEYVEKVWVNGNFPPETLVMFQHDGETTNNHSEGYNYRLGSKKRISKHPNAYLFVSLVIEELQPSMRDAVMAKQGNVNKKRSNNSRRTKIIEMKKNLMERLEENTVELLAYQQAMGGSVVNNLTAAREVDASSKPLIIHGTQY